MADHSGTLWIKRVKRFIFSNSTCSFFFLDGETSLNVIITDVNDNSPLFTNDTYTIHQREEVLGETDMMNITADDADSGSNSLIDYVIESGNISKYGKDYIVVFLPSFVLISNF